MSAPPPPPPGPVVGPRAGHVVLELVVPVLDEERTVEHAVRSLHGYLNTAFPYSFRITVADSASTDSTPQIARRLAAELPEVAVIRQPERGRGRALRAAWTNADADVLAYCDVDLSTDLNALLPLVAPLISGHSEVAIGTRLARGARVVRGPKREVLSRGYNLILRGTLRAHFSDAQCGFKAIRADAAQQLVPLVEDESWFFDTELLVLAEQAGLRIHEVPVDWVDDPDSRVDILRTCLEDLRGIARIGRNLITGSLPLGPVRDRLTRSWPQTPPADRVLSRQLLRFAVIGIGCTLAHLLLYLLLRQFTGAVVANAVALVVTNVLNTAANRLLTFGVRGRAGAVRHQMQGFVIFAAGLVLTTGMLALVPPGGGRAPEIIAIAAGNVAATVLRFVLFRAWVFRSARPTSAPEASK